MEKIYIKINKNTYEITVEAEGYDGTTCIKDVDEIMDLLKASTIKEELKDDYFNVRRTGKVSLKNQCGEYDNSSCS